MAKKSSAGGKNSSNSGSKSGSLKKSSKNSSVSSGGSRAKNSGSISSAVKKQWIIRIVAILVIGLILGASVLFFEEKINAYLRLKGLIEEDYSGLSVEEAVGGVTRLDEKLNVHFVDVGQGDACIIELPDQRKIIIDGGKDKEKQKLIDYIDQNIFAEPDDDGVQFDFAILTHSDEDHCGGLDDVMSRYTIGTFYRPNQLATYNNYNDPGKSQLFGDVTAGGKNTLAYMRTVDAGHKKAQNVIVTNARDSSQNRIVPSGVSESDPSFYEINFYTPTRDNYRDVNDYSPIMVLIYQNKRIVLSGDAEAEAEKEFVDLVKAGSDRYSIFDVNYNVDLIKLGHHGSRTSSSTDYLETLTTPSGVQNVIAIISCGTGNSYGHPHPEVVDRLIDMGFTSDNILRTDTNGNIAMSIRQDEDGQFKLFYGAEAIRTNYQSPITYREIALLIFCAAVMVILIQPLAKKKRARARRG